MAKDQSLHNYSHIQANLLRGGQQGALSQLYAGIVDELQRDIMPQLEDLLLLLETMGPPKATESIQSDRQKVLELIQAVMLLLEQDDFLQGAKSYHLNLQKRKPVNALEQRLKTLNFVDAYKLINRS